MHSWPRPDARRPSRALAALLAAAALIAAPAAAAPERIEVLGAELVRSEQGYALNASFEVGLGSAVEEALRRGVALHFAVDFELVRLRRYWFDQTVVTGQRTLKLSYNALTRQYRVTTGSLYQNYANLPSALSALGRVYRMPVAKPGELDSDGTYRAAVRMRLDVDQLPLPFQVNSLGTGDWRLDSEWYRWDLNKAQAALAPGAP